MIWNGKKLRIFVKVICSSILILLLWTLSMHYCRFQFLSLFCIFFCNASAQLGPIPPQLLIIKPTRCTNFSNVFLGWKSTCFGKFLCPSSGVFTVYTAMVYVIQVCRQFVLLLFVLFYILFVCKYVLYYCHRVTTQLQLTNILYQLVWNTLLLRVQ
jgi:hypothetical protein